MQASCRLTFDLNISIREHKRIVNSYNLRYHIEKELPTSCQDLLQIDCGRQLQPWHSRQSKYVGSVYFASCSNSTAGALLPLKQNNCLKLSCQVQNTQPFLLMTTSITAQSNGQVLSWFQCCFWQAVLVASCLFG